MKKATPSAVAESPPPPRLEDFSAPYHFSAEKIYLTYRARRDRLARALPQPYLPRPILGQYLFVFEAAHFFNVRGSNNSPRIAPYNELIHFAPAWFDGIPTYAMWKLFLDDPLPIVLGRELYGFPKHLATIDYEKDAKSLRVAATPENNPAIELSLRRSSAVNAVPLLDRLLGGAARHVTTSTELVFPAPDADQVIRSRIGDVQIAGARAVEVERACIPLFVELDLLRPAEVHRPLLAVHISTFHITLSAPARARRGDLLADR